MSAQPNYALCTILYILSHFVGLALMVLIGLWINYDKKGFGFHEDLGKEFKFHPILMSLSLLFLNGEAIMIYRGLRFWPKWLTKFIHALLHTVTFTIMVLGLKAIWDTYDYSTPPATNALTPHSWVGLSTASLYGLQFAGGLLTFYLPITPLHVRQTVMPMHRTGGMIIFGFSLGTVLMGSGMVGSGIRCTDPEAICEKRLFANVFVLCVLGYSACVFGIVATSSWIRQPLPDEATTVQPYEHASATTYNVTNAWSTQGTYRQNDDHFKTSL